MLQDSTLRYAKALAYNSTAKISAMVRYLLYCTHIHLYMYLLHGILHQFVNVLVVFNGTLILEVTAKCEHDVVCPEVTSL